MSGISLQMRRKLRQLEESKKKREQAAAERASRGLETKRPSMKPPPPSKRASWEDSLKGDDNDEILRKRPPKGSTLKDSLLQKDDIGTKILKSAPKPPPPKASSFVYSRKKNPSSPVPTHLNAQKASPASPLSFSQASSHAEKPKQNRRIQFESDSSGSELEDLAGAMLRRRDEKIAATKKKKNVREDSDEEEDRKPAAVEKKRDTSFDAGNVAAPPSESHRTKRLWSNDFDDSEDDVNIEKKRPSNSSSVRESNNVAPSPVKYSVVVNEAKLWEDSDDGAEQEEPPKESRTVKNSKKRSSRSSDHRSSGDFAYENIDYEEPKPNFDAPKFGPFDREPVMLSDKHSIPTNILRYLLDYQVEGVKFMYSRTQNPDDNGVILGDDMGLGKTVQVIALLAALLEKSGTGADKAELYRRRRRVQEFEAEQRSANRKALDSGVPWTNKTDSKIPPDLGLPKWAPVVVIAPKAVVSNWSSDMDTWGHFSYVKYEGSEKERALESIRNGTAEIMLLSKSLLDERGLSDLKTIPWKLIVADECHVYKNAEAKVTNCLRGLIDASDGVVVGLTGTVMQNNHKELWTLVDYLVTRDYLGPWKQFEAEFSRPIKLGRSSNATADAIRIGREKGEELSMKLSNLYIKRTKEEQMRELLPNKDEKIVFCDLSDFQKQVYRHVLEQPDFVLLYFASAPCDCGVNDGYFRQYKGCVSVEEKIDFQRNKKNEVIARGRCCYRTPTEPDTEDIHPDAVLWQKLHPDNVECGRCPYCIIFPVLHVLYKLASHASLLQIDRLPSYYEEGSKDEKLMLQKLKEAKVFIPEECVGDLPGGSFVRETTLLDDHFALSGKMRKLDELLKFIDRQNGRVLLFSTSTQVLDLIQNYLKSKGFSHSRVDGSTQNRDAVIKEYKENKDIFVFLLSTRAMGLGVNLTEANYVIIFDVEWNPSYDKQAQDRAYRIGQQQNVTVFRLVSKGTIEELKYLRQVYKTQLQEETLIDVMEESRDEAARLFRGVDGDRTRRGELFGLANLLKLKDGTFMPYLRNVSPDAARRTANIETCTREDVLNTVLEDIDSPDTLTELGLEGEMFDNIALKRVSEQESDEEEELGGDSQAAMDVCERMPTPPPGIEEDELSPVAEHMAVAVAEPVFMGTHTNNFTPNREIPLAFAVAVDSPSLNTGVLEPATQRPTPEIVGSAAAENHSGDVRTQTNNEAADGTTGDGLADSCSLERQNQTERDETDSPADELLDPTRSQDHTNEPAAASRPRKRRNVALFGTSLKQIRKKGTGESTFNISDLRVPGGRDTEDDDEEDL